MLRRARRQDRTRALALCSRLPTQPVQIAAWIHEGGLEQAAPSTLFIDSRGRGLAFVSELGVVMPFLHDEDSIDELAHRVGHRARVVVGPAWATEALWCRLERRGIRARIVRDQVGYAASRSTFRGPPKSESIDLSRAEPDDLGELVSACAAMAIEESRDDPARRNPELFRARIEDRIENGRDFVYREGGKLVFKVNVSCLSPYGGHIEGVYSLPQARGRGLGRAGTAWITAWILRRSPMATLLVNRDNDVAQRIYETLGFVRTHESRTVLAR